MKDLFKKYHRHRVLSNLGILSLSAILAVSVNTFLLSGPTWDTLKANILESTAHTNIQQDFVAATWEENISFQNTRLLQDVKAMSFSLAYNPEFVSFLDVQSQLSGVQIVPIENEDGFSTYILSFESPSDIYPLSDLLDLKYEKLENTTVHLNIINVNFTDTSGTTYSLSTSWIMF